LLKAWLFLVPDTPRTAQDPCGGAQDHFAKGFLEIPVSGYSGYVGDREARAYDPEIRNLS